MKERRIGIGGVVAIGLLTALVSVSMLVLRSEIRASNTCNLSHSWIVQNVDGEEVTFCEECGKQKSSNEHIHSWKAQKADDKIVVICEECGKIAEE